MTLRRHAAPETVPVNGVVSSQVIGTAAPVPATPRAIRCHGWEAVAVVDHVTTGPLFTVPPMPQETRAEAYPLAEKPVKETSAEMS